MVYMVVHNEGRSALVAAELPQKSAARSQQRWPLLVSLLGAVALSVALWAGIFWFATGIFDRFVG